MEDWGVPISVSGWEPGQDCSEHTAASEWFLLVDLPAKSCSSQDGSTSFSAVCFGREGLNLEMFLRW